jgi:hypothetical protein
MSNIAQFMAAKLPILAGAGILGVSIAGVCAAIIGASFTIEAELISAAVGMLAAGFVVAKYPDK